MNYNTNDLSELKNLWKAAEGEEVELQFPIPDRPETPLGAVPIPISNTARHKAIGMAKHCRKADRQETMRRNLLATIVVHDYLRLQGYLPDLAASDCWNPILGSTGEVADLVVSQVGRIECCAIEPTQLYCAVPIEGQFGRSGYVAVEMDAEERWGWLLGFIPGGDEINPVEVLNRNELQSMDDFGYLLHRLWLLWTIVQEGAEPWDVEMRSGVVVLLERIYRTHSSAQRPTRAAAEMSQLWGEEVTGAEVRELTGASREGDNPAQSELRQFLEDVFDRLEDSLEIEAEPDSVKLVNLGQWLYNQSETSQIGLKDLTPAFRYLNDRVNEGWQNLEAFFSAEELTPAYSMRSRSTSVQKGKLIRLATEVTGQTIVLILTLNPQSETDTNIIMEVRPQSDRLYLPEGLQIEVLDDQRKAVMQAIASSTNQNIQFDFNVGSGERFSVQMILETASVTEEFIVGSANE
jgi:Protein of unknown function (DUF1822)